MHGEGNGNSSILAQEIPWTEECYSPWRLKELSTTEHTRMHTHTHTHTGCRPQEVEE